MDMEIFKAFDDTFENILGLINSAWLNFRSIFTWIIGAMTVVQLAMHLIRFGLHGKSDESPVGFVLKVATWWIVVLSAPGIMFAVQTTFVRLGAIAGGSKVLDRPSAILEAGWIAAYPILGMIGSVAEFFDVRLRDIGDALNLIFVNLPKILVGFVVWIVVLAAYIVILVQVVLAYVEFAILGAIAAIILPLGILKLGSFIPEKLIGSVTSHGVKLLLQQFIIGIGISLFSVDLLEPGETIDDVKYIEIIVLAVNAALFAALVLNIPAMATGILSGQPSLSGSSAAAGVGSAASATGGAAVGRAVGSAAGGIQQAAKSLQGAKQSGGLGKLVGLSPMGAMMKKAMAAGGAGGGRGRATGGPAGGRGAEIWKRLGGPSAAAGKLGLAKIAGGRFRGSGGAGGHYGRSPAAGREFEKAFSELTKHGLGAAPPEGGAVPMLPEGGK